MRHIVVLLAAVACGSENKVADDPGTNRTQDPPETNTGTTPGDTAGDTPPGDDDDTNPPTGDDDDATGDDDDATGDDDDTTGDPPTDLTEDEICEQAAALAISLDVYQTPKDGRVIYCHGGNDPNATLNYIETDISSCLPHLNHSADVFPTSGCDS